MFTINKTGGSTTIAKGDRITSIGGASRDLYVVGVEPYAQGMRRRARALNPVSVTLERFNQLNPSTLAPEYYTAEAIQAQIKTEKSARYKTDGDSSDGNYGPNAPESREILYINNPDTTKNFGVIRVVTSDEARGLMFPDLFTIQFIPAPSEAGGDDDLMIPPTETPGDPVTLDAVFVELTDQFAPSGPVLNKVGDAVVKVKRGSVSFADLTANGAYIRITIPGGTAIDYHLWNGAQGVKQEQTYHWTLHLRRAGS